MEIGRYCQKYLPLLKRIILNQSPAFTSDKNFIQAILQQYPVIFCSNITPIDFNDGVPGEQLHEGELSMKDIKLIFVDEKYINDIKAKLALASLQSIGVIAYQENPEGVNFTYRKSNFNH